MRVVLLCAIVAILAGCTVETSQTPATARPAPQEPIDPSIQARADAAATRFVNVITRMEPVAERVCRERGVPQCDFQIQIDDRPGQPPNAFQTVNRRGRPILAFNLALITSVRNADELAFVVGHEAAHHIEGHLDRMQQSATVGAVIFGSVAAATGADSSVVRAGQELGAAVGARSFSKEFELEADALGTVITHRAGYDPVRGARFFDALPDPGNRFLGTHPPNADRIATVRRVAAQL